MREAIAPILVGNLIRLVRWVVFGLTCSRYQSGEVVRSGKISRCGDEMMRTMLYEAAQSMMHSKKLVLAKGLAMQIARRRGMKKAIVALARRLTVITPRIGLMAPSSGGPGQHENHSETIGEN